MAERIRCNWVVSLSDGTTRTESEFLAAQKPGWGSILELVNQGLKLTGMRLQRAGLTHTAPSISPHAKFPSDVPFELDHRRRAAKSSDGPDEFYCNYTVKAGGILIKFWVDETTGDTWMQLEGAK